MGTGAVEPLTQPGEGPWLAGFAALDVGNGILCNFPDTRVASPATELAPDLPWGPARVWGGQYPRPRCSPPRLGPAALGVAEDAELTPGSALLDGGQTVCLRWGTPAATHPQVTARLTTDPEATAASGPPDKPQGPGPAAAGWTSQPVCGNQHPKLRDHRPRGPGPGPGPSRPSQGGHGDQAHTVEPVSVSPRAPEGRGSLRLCP